MTSLPSKPSRPARSYQRESIIVVHTTRERFGGLSNMAGGYPIHVNGLKILTSEALYQTCRFPHIPELQRKIIEQRSPMTAKRICQPFLEQSRPDWYEIRTKIMRWCLRVKLAQNYESFGALLLATQNHPIVEFSKKDDFWGAKEKNSKNEILVGQNILGRLLMELRELLKNDIERTLTTVEPLKISNFALYGNPIETISSEMGPYNNDPINPQLF